MIPQAEMLTMLFSLENPAQDDSSSFTFDLGDLIRSVHSDLRCVASTYFMPHVILLFS
jgi:hypothetical protein